MTWCHTVSPGTASFCNSCEKRAASKPSLQCVSPKHTSYYERCKASHNARNQKPEIRERNHLLGKAWRQTSSGQMYHQKSAKRQRDRIRLIVFEHYGTRCACCGFDDLDLKVSGRSMMQVDHIDGNGAAHRREIGVVGGNSFYRWLIANDFPDGFRSLCAGCNMCIRPGESKCELHKWECGREVA